MDKPPEGKHSTKGLGKKMPQESEYAKWRGNVTVPCGKPVPSNVKASELMYNEYIVYNTAQVSFKSGVFLSYNANEPSNTCLNCDIIEWEISTITLVCSFNFVRKL